MGLTQNFVEWLDSNGYGEFDFKREDLIGGSFGGKESASEKINHQPVVFIHGNSDIVVGDTYWQTGFTESIEYFLAQGYSKGELYATTWGDGNKDHDYTRIHDFDTLHRLRKFFEAVLAYTGAEKIDVITHSMGVTLGRKIIKGGRLVGDEQGRSLGAPLNHHVDTFVGICGANLGLVNCYSFADMLPTCNAVNGYYPGTSDSSDMAAYMKDLQQDPTREGDNIFSIFSTADDLIGFGDVVWGAYTSQFATQDGYVMKTSYEYGHIATRDLTKDQQYDLVTKHQTAELNHGQATPDSASQ